MFTNLETKRLVLKCIGYEDVDFILKQFSTNEVNQYLYDAEPISSKEEAKEIIDFYMEPEPRDQHRWIIILKENNEKIGTCGFHCWNNATGEVELGYDLQPGYWRRGYMNEALTEIMNFAKEKMQIGKVYAHIYPKNLASVGIVEKMGFERTGEQYYEVFRGEKYLHDIYCWKNKADVSEIVLLTLENSEVDKLYNNIKEVVSVEEAEKIIAEIPLASKSTPEERAEWVDKMSCLLEKKYDWETIKRIRQGCFCNENGRLEETAQALRNLYLSVDKDIRKFVDTINESGAGWYFEDNYLYTKYFSCPCPMLEKAGKSKSLTWCQCTAGYTKKIFKLAFNLSVDVDVVHAIRQGYKDCLLRVTFL